MKMLLNKDWQLTWEDLSWGPSDYYKILNKDNGWLPAELPCDVHMPLIKHGIIPEPLIEDNCFQCEWIEQKSWWFQKRFIVTPEHLEAENADLTLESLDAEADIWLNGVHLGHHRSAFYPFSSNVKSLLKQGGNVLLVRVTSGLEHYSAQDYAHTERSLFMIKNDDIGIRGDERRVLVRKPQYVYGWDWNPRVATCGIMRDVYIKFSSTIQICDIHVTTMSVTPAAQLRFELELENYQPFASREAEIQLVILLNGNPAASINTNVCLQSGLNYLNLQTEVPEPMLWWPNGMGEQPLYTLQAVVVSGDVRLSYPEIRFGIRTVRLNTDIIADGERRFTFEINGVPIFCKGANWIPADSIYARVTGEKYAALIGEAKAANFNMLRIWGGGIYETQLFYELCDEMGIMVWHDFMFSCGKFPDHLPWFRQEVESEIDYQTRRLRNHCSIVLWCGNNENHYIFDEHEHKLPDFLGGWICYGQIAPRIVRRNCPDIPYWVSSPYGGEHPNGNEMGDRHHWYDCMMHPEMEKRITPEEYDKVTAKFISEYGYVGACRKSTIEAYHGGHPLDRNGKIWRLHNNTFENETVPAGIRKHYADPERLDIDDYVLFSGLCQGLMLSYSLESIRSKLFCSGALFWMYNDCWGEVGWTIIDYYLKRKIAYHFVKRAFAPVKLIIREKNGTVEVTGINDTAQTIQETLEYGTVSFNGEYGNLNRMQVTFQPHSREVLLTIVKEAGLSSNEFYFVRPASSSSVLLPAVLRKVPFRELNVPKPNLTVSGFERSGSTVHFTVTSDTFAHGVHFGLAEEINLSDEYFDLLPGEKREIFIHNAPTSLQETAIHPNSICSNSSFG